MQVLPRPASDSGLLRTSRLPSQAARIQTKGQLLIGCLLSAVNAPAYRVIYLTHPIIGASALRRALPLRSAAKLPASGGGRLSPIHLCITVCTCSTVFTRPHRPDASGLLAIGAGHGDGWTHGAQCSERVVARALPFCKCEAVLRQANPPIIESWTRRSRRQPASIRSWS